MNPRDRDYLVGLTVVLVVTFLIGWVWHDVQPCQQAQKRITDTQACMIYWNCTVNLNELAQYRDDLVFISNHCERT